MKKMYNFGNLLFHRIFVKRGGFMKKIMKFILFTIFLVFSVSGLFSQTTEQTLEVLLKFTFSKDYTLDSSSMRFSLKDDILEYEYSNGGDCGDYWESGIAQINGNKIHFIRIKEYSEVATEKKEYDGELLDFGQPPNVNYRYRLKTPRDTLEGGEVKDGEEVLCDGQKCIKYSERIVLKNSAKRYTAPNFSADLFISNDVIGDTKLPNNYVVFPGMTKRAFGVIKNKVNGSGVKGSWYVLADNLTPSPYPYYWVFVPENSFSVYKYDDYPDPNLNDSKVLKSKEDEFWKAVRKQTFSYLTSEEREKLSNRRWWDYYDYSVVFDDVKLFDNRSEIKAGKTKKIKENLRLRKNDNLGSEVITTIKEGSQVKILETGEPEVIEDIYSFWVKVQIVNGTDRDGNSLKAGTCGWCFGGYLE